MEKTLRNKIKNFAAVLFIAGYFFGCNSNKESNSPLEKVAGNDEVLNYMKTFDGRGALSDTSQPLPPEKALASFRHPDDLVLDLILSEPSITQPLHISFDHRGRLWVVQYNQYPYPEGLKVMSMDQHIRATFDKVPQPPNEGIQGVDKISFFEDTDGDGDYDKATDAITGLNIATSVALGRGQIWVLNPPYLLAYPDTDNDGLPDGPPVVHLKGFGLEDTHAVANNLTWGVDGWLYGAQGSTCTANISSTVSKNVKFDGQAIWRYHPGSHVFEIFAEGGGNTFDVEIDSKGRLYSGDNGTDRGQYYKPGGYYVKNFGKHGAHSNPYTFGYLSNMALEGENIRFTHAFIKYEGGTLPARYNGDMIALNPLQSYVQLTRFESVGSTFKNIDEERILETDDPWFRPVDITTGPGGAVYIADWYDSRLTHVDPRDTWNKTTGRIYRLRNKKVKLGGKKFDVSTYSNDQLIELFSHQNKWFQQQALQQFADKKDRSVIPKLTQLLSSDTGQVALNALWAINFTGGFNDQVAASSLNHSNPFVRMWGVRLLGDAKKVSPIISDQLTRLASTEPYPEVRSQLAATAKRLPGSNAIPIIRELLKNHDDASDPDIPLQIWWALESKSISDRQAVLDMFADRDIWNKQTVQETIFGNLMQRFVLEGGTENFSACAQLLKMAPSPKHAKLLINGLQEGLRGRDLIALSPDLVKALKPYEGDFKKESLALALRQGNKQELDKALSIIADPHAAIGERLSLIRIMGEIEQPKSIPVLLGIAETNQSSAAIKQAALQSLQRYDEPEIGERVAKAYPDKLRADPDVRASALALFASRSAWAFQLLNAIDRKKQPGETFIGHTINKEDVPEQIVRQLKLLNDASVVEAANRIWPEVRLATSDEKNERIERVSKLLRSGNGNPEAGRGIFINNCGSCHRLFDKGGNLGPDLTGYDRSNLNDLLANIIDPGAYIREGYVTYQVVTTDGRTVVGAILSRMGSTITVQPAGSEKMTLSTEQIKDIQEQKVSSMPERLLDGLTAQQIRDLFSYLMKEKEK